MAAAKVSMVATRTHSCGWRKPRIPTKVLTTRSASTSALRSLAGDLAGGTTWTVDSVNVPRGHTSASQNQRRLHQVTSTAPAMGTSRTRSSSSTATMPTAPRS